MGVTAASLSGKEVQPTVNRLPGAGHGGVGCPGRAPGRDEPCLQGKWLRRSGRRHLRVEARTRRGPGERIEPHLGSATGCPVKDWGEGHPQFQEGGDHPALGLFNTISKG